ncbi:MAG TPA: hypothetical protein VGR67_14700 [Candidatus Polarisedimenticolia bacterium]|jgi:hypothetical protein|nr:hypothetical protein [Candidatus Polarisedimenticolia bacterium]
MSIEPITADASAVAGSEPGIPAPEIHRPGVPGATSEAPEIIPQREGTSPLWRSLLSPWQGQRALALNPESVELFESLAQNGVRVEWDPPVPGAAHRESFDLILEDWSRRRNPWRRAKVGALLAPGGRWVIVMQGRPWVGWSARAALWRARRENFERIDTYYAHPSLQAPQILVPLDRPEPFRYFLGLTLDVRTLRHRILVLGLQTLWALGIHRESLPNLIVVARRGK